MSSINKLKSEVKAKIRTNHLFKANLADGLGVTPRTIERWMRLDDLRLLSIPVLQQIEAEFKLKRSEIVE